MKPQDIKTAITVQVEANGAQGLDQLGRTVTFLRELRQLGYIVETDGYLNVTVTRSTFSPPPPPSPCAPSRRTAREGSTSSGAP